VFPRLSGSDSAISFCGTDYWGWAMEMRPLSCGQQVWREGEGSGSRQVKFLPAPQLLPESACQSTRTLDG